MRWSSSTQPPRTQNVSRLKKQIPTLTSPLHANFPPLSSRVFGPSVPNTEGLSRRNLAALLPSSSSPKLLGYNGEGPYLTVVGHDWETFAEQAYTGILHTPRLLTMTYANPFWQKYNEGLVKITDEGKAVGPLIAVGCGHFVQKDSPEFVGDELVSLLDRVVNRMEQVKEG
jgi:hypothetical protein